MKRRCISLILAIAMFLSMFSVLVIPANAITAGIGEKVFDGGMRDFKWPVPGWYGISGCFKEVRSGGRFGYHYALDIPANAGTTVVAAYSGDVVDIRTNGVNDGGYGNTVIVKHTYVKANGNSVELFTQYAHLDYVSVKVGNHVEGGVTKIGGVGGSGYGSSSYYGNHLDFQILTANKWGERDKYSIDPYINELLELPSGLFCNSTESCCGVGPTGCCCKLYVDYVKELYKNSTYLSQCKYYPSYLTVKTPTASKLWNMPCSDSTSDEAVNVGVTKAGDTLTVTAMYLNTRDNYWYEVSYNGTTCYIYGGNTTFVDTRYDDITFTDAVIPSQITVGSSFVIGGVIKTKYNQFQSVNGSVTSPYGSFLDCTDEVVGKYYSLQGSKIDKQLTFGTLEVGTYYYAVSIYVENYYTTDGRTLSYDYCHPGMCCELFDVIKKAEHVCTFDTYVYDEAAHPHYKCYQCSTCKKVSRNTSQPTQSNTCNQCRPGKGVLNVNLSSDGTASFTWASTANTTHYNVWLARKNTEGKWESVEQVFYAESGFQRTFSEGEYRAQLLSYSSKMWEPDGSDWVHTWADDVFFTVSDGTYTVRYDANGGSGAPSSQTESVGTYIELSRVIPARFGYSFQGWATDSSASTVVYWPGAVYTDNTSVTLYAVWREAEVLSGDTIGHFSENAYINCPDTGAYFAFIPNTSTEYRIMSESDEDTCVELFDANGNLLASDDDGSGDRNFLLTYHFTANENYYIYVRYYSDSLVGTIDFKISKRCSVTYDANGGTGAPEPQYHFYDEDVTLSTLVPTRPGYFFMGWSADSSAIDPQYLPGWVISGYGDLTLYAIWLYDPNYRATYTVSYNANGGTDAPASQNGYMGSSLGITSELPNRFGYNFEGWAISSYASAPDYLPNDTYTDGVSITLYAVWSEAEVFSGENIGNFDDTAYISFPNASACYAFIPDASTTYRITSESYDDTLVHLYDAYGNLLASDDDGGENSNFLLTYQFTANKTYYIYILLFDNSRVGDIDFSISKQYSITYDANGGTGAPETQYYFFDEYVTLSKEEPTRSGYIFDGWAESAIATEPRYLPGDTCNQNTDLVLYAIWKTKPTIVASGICGIDLVWTFTRNGCLTISGTGAMFDFEEFESPWGDYYLQIKRVVIEPGATSIGEFAFKSCLYLTSVQLPDSVSSIGDLAFESCDSLPGLVLPNGLTSIGSLAFGWCSNLSSITIPANVNLIADGAFACCDNLTQITFVGNAPTFEGDVFTYVTAEAYYPANNPTWTADVMQDYGGSIIWRPYDQETQSFTDVPEGSFFYDAVMWAVENGITNGTGPATFAPGDLCLRAHVVTFLWRAAGCPEPQSTVNPFVDVQSGSFYEKAVLWAVENGITTGTDASHFSPGTVCNRATVVTFLYRAFGSPEVENTSNPFTDVSDGQWFTAPVLWAVQEGITNGTSNTTFGPGTSCNRAQIVTFLYRAYN